MKLVGTVRKVTESYITIETTSKKQEIDVFFTDTKSQAMIMLFQEHMTASLIVDVQSVEMGFIKFGKFWLISVDFPGLPVDDHDLNSRQRERREIISTLYKNTK